MSESASHLRAVSSTDQKPSLVGANGVRTPGRRDGPPRSLTEVIVELGHGVVCDELLAKIRTALERFHNPPQQAVGGAAS